MTPTSLRVAVDARELCGRPTGVGRYLASLLDAWQRAGVPHRITLYAPSMPQWPASAGPQTLGAAFTVRAVPGGRGTWWEQIQLPAALAADRPDVLFAPAYTAPIRTRIPVVLTIHDLSFAAHPEWFGRREGFRRRGLTRWSARRAAAIVAVSEFSRQEILTRYGCPPERVRAIHSGLPQVAGDRRDHEPRATGHQSTEPGAGPLILYSGSIFNRRHVPDLVKAFAQVAASHPHARLVIAGDNRTHPHEPIAALVQQLGLADRVDLRAYVTDPDLADLYGRARVFVFLSEYEGFGFTPLEALQAGVPIVVADTPVAREIYGPAAVYVPVGDVSACAAALDRLLDDEASRRNVLSEAPAVLARYSWDRAGQATMALIEEAAG